MTWWQWTLAGLTAWLAVAVIAGAGWIWANRRGRRGGS